MSRLFEDIFYDVFRYGSNIQGTPFAPASFPAFNVRKVDDTNYVIEVALAGYTKDDVSIELEKNRLTIKGKGAESVGQYIWKGLAKRAFTNSFQLAPTIKVGEATFENGILAIALENVIPEADKPKTIAIK